MSRTPARVTQADVERAIRAARRQGLAAVDVLPDGTIRILLAAPPVQPSAPAYASAPVDDDEVIPLR